MDNLRYMYIRDENRNPFGVVVTRKVGNQLEYNYSVCNPKDKFSKEIAKKIALGRLETSNYAFELYEDDNRHTITAKVFFLLSRNSLPSKAVKFLNRWLDTHEEKLWGFLRRNWRSACLYLI